MDNFQVRNATIDDKNQILVLYKNVSQHIGTLARTSEEITQAYIDNFSLKSQTNGVQLIVTDNENGTIIVAEIHCYKLEPQVFSHILSELTIAVHPNYQGTGIGKLIFQTLLKSVSQERKDILRIELIARESNQKAIEFYQKLGFVIEGRLEKRIHNSNNTFEADIPMAWFNKNYKQK